MHTRTHACVHAHTLYRLIVVMDNGLDVTMQKMHTHTHTVLYSVQTDSCDGQCCLAEIFSEEKCFEFAFEERESRRVPDVLGEIVPDVGAKV